MQTLISYIGTVIRGNLVKSPFFRLFQNCDANSFYSMRCFYQDIRFNSIVLFLVTLQQPQPTAVSFSYAITTVVTSVILLY